MSHPFTKLTPDDVEQLRYERVTYRISYPRLAAQFGISIRHAMRICRGERWQNVVGPVAPLVGRGARPLEPFVSRNARNQRRYRAAKRTQKRREPLSGSA